MKTNVVTSVSPEAFVRIWQECESVHQVMQKTGMSRAAVKARAAFYRKKGVTALKRMVGAAPVKINVKALNKIAMGCLR